MANVEANQKSAIEGADIADVAPEPVTPTTSIEEAKRTSAESSAPSRDVLLSQSAIQFLAYPVGKAWEFAIPDWRFNIRGRRVSLNPGPFNYKENILIYIMANLSFLTRLSADVLTEQRIFYGLKAGWGFELTVTLATILYGFALAGLCYALIVEPPQLLWPGVLGNTALNAALHTGKRKDETE
ncbi:sexual differentiation process protein isp4 [Colletotrichum salicis]|uniref:Sexual differentiation process protein isp4 n=1 Tax=Colletotrichum salicis TaxID=1209931 RepID=A0A135SI80_9PEZI|nr:sexual differentiation process protein isp4 [Colletotrichum salicis]